MSRIPWYDALTERLVVALVSGVAAALMLALYPLALVVLGRGSGGGGEFELGAYFYSFVFSKIGLVVIIGTSFVGFCVGSERMAEIFSFFWGTHGFWRSVGNYLDDKSGDLQAEHNIPLWLSIVFFIALALVAVKIFE